MNVQQFLQQCSRNGVIDLDLVVNRRQEILSQDKQQPGFFENLMKKLQGWKADERAQFLFNVGEYHTLSGRTDLQTSDRWSEIGAQFEKLHEAGPVVNFYKWNYAFLCYRNAKMVGRLDLLYFEAAAAAENLEEMEKAEALGHLRYNYARHLLSQEKTEEALKLWQDAAFRRQHFLGLLNFRNAKRETLLAAAQQVAKIRFDFLQFFPGEEIEECGVTEAKMQALQEEFGDSIGDFSVKK